MTTIESKSKRNRVLNFLINNQIQCYIVIQGIPQIIHISISNLLKYQLLLSLIEVQMPVQHVKDYINLANKGTVKKDFKLVHMKKNNLNSVHLSHSQLQGRMVMIKEGEVLMSFILIRLDRLKDCRREERKQKTNIFKKNLKKKRKFLLLLNNTRIIIRK